MYCTFSDELAGKTVIITGASAGIGEEIAYHYAQAGASVTYNSQALFGAHGVDRCLFHLRFSWSPVEKPL